MNSFIDLKSWSLDLKGVHAFITESGDQNGVLIYEAIVEYNGSTLTEDWIGTFELAMVELVLMVRSFTPYFVGNKPFMYNLDDLTRVVS